MYMHQVSYYFVYAFYSGLVTVREVLNNSWVESSRVGLGGGPFLTGRVVSGQGAFTYHGSGRFSP